MDKMRRLMCLLLAVAMLLTLTACGNSKKRKSVDDDDDEDEEESSVTTTIDEETTPTTSPDGLISAPVEVGGDSTEYKYSVPATYMDAENAKLAYVTADTYVFKYDGDSTLVGATQATLVNKTNGKTAKLCLNLTARQREMLLAGGCLNYTKNKR